MFILDLKMYLMWHFVTFLLNVLLCGRILLFSPHMPEPELLKYIVGNDHILGCNLQLCERQTCGTAKFLLVLFKGKLVK